MRTYPDPRFQCAVATYKLGRKFEKSFLGYMFTIIIMLANLSNNENLVFIFVSWTVILYERKERTRVENFSDVLYHLDRQNLDVTFSSGMTKELETPSTAATVEIHFQGLGSRQGQVEAGVGQKQELKLDSQAQNELDVVVYVTKLVSQSVVNS